MNPEFKTFLGHFNKVIEGIQKYRIFVRARELQSTSVSTLEAVAVECRNKKSQAIKFSQEDSANAYLAMEFIAMAFASELKMYLALKDDKPDEGWDHLVDAEDFAANAMKSHELGAKIEGYIDHLYALEALLFPTLMFMSAGMIIERAECSICGLEYGECDHIKGRPYMGQLCTRRIKKWKATEISAVKNPADKRCRVLHFAKEKQWYNTFTHRAVSEESIGSTPSDGCADVRFT